MPGIVTKGGAAGYERLPDRLAKLLLDSTAALEREAAEPNPNAEAVARKVGVIARSGAALALFDARLARRGARRSTGDPDPTEEADMDDADDSAREGADYSDAELERCARNLSRNLRLGRNDGGWAEDAGAVGPAEDDAQLGRSREPPPMAA